MSEALFAESLVNQTTPWAACIALEAFLAAGGQCKVSDETNWVGIAYICDMRSDNEPPQSPQLHHALAWAHLAITVRESMATDYSAEDSWGIIKGAMWIRTKMIIRCGNHPGDRICDLAMVVDWCLSTPEVQRFLKLEHVPPFGSLGPEVREIGDILVTVIAAGRLKKEGRVAEFLGAIRLAKTMAAS